MRLLKTFLRDNTGQDLIEYTLLVAFVAVCSAALLLMNQQAVNGIWTTAQTDLQNANAQAS
jgi:Flp pilus assembly pilin Flp